MPDTLPAVKGCRPVPAAADGGFALRQIPQKWTARTDPAADSWDETAPCTAARRPCRSPAKVLPMSARITAGAQFPVSSGGRSGQSPALPERSRPATANGQCQTAETPARPAHVPELSRSTSSPHPLLFSIPHFCEKYKGSY